MSGDMPSSRPAAKAFFRDVSDFVWPPRSRRARAALIYDEFSRRLALDLNRAGRRDGLSTFAGWMRQVGGDLIGNADVLATGATLPACTRALKQSGARQVDVLVLARVVRETDVTIY